MQSIFLPCPVHVSPDYHMIQTHKIMVNILDACLVLQHTVEVKELMRGRVRRVY